MAREGKAETLGADVDEPDIVKALVAAGAGPSALDAARMFGNTELLTLLQP